MVLMFNMEINDIDELLILEEIEELLYLED